jgi:hypothetical protein
MSSRLLCVVLAATLCLLMPALAVARGGGHGGGHGGGGHGGGGHSAHGGSNRGHGGNYHTNYNVGYPGVGPCCYAPRTSGLKNVPR